MAKKQITPVACEEMDEMHQAVLQQFAWIEDTDRERRIQELLLVQNLQQLCVTDMAVAAILKYIELSKDGETTSSRTQAKITAQAYLNVCEELDFLEEEVLVTYRKMLE